MPATKKTFLAHLRENWSVLAGIATVAGMVAIGLVKIGAFIAVIEPIPTHLANIDKHLADNDCQMARISGALGIPTTQPTSVAEK